MPLIETRGALTSRAYGEFALQAASVAPNYIEDVFSTWLYIGTSSNQTIANGIDLLGKGGMVWEKTRNQSNSHFLADTAQTGFVLRPNFDAERLSDTSKLYFGDFLSNGFTTGSAWGSTNSRVSWTFRKQAKFFDVVTYTGNGANRTIAHNLGSVPGCIIVKRTDAIGNWQVYHRSLANTEYMVLNSTAAKATGATRWNSTTPTATVFSLGTDATVNASGGTYVAYLFAHDAGGFGASGTDNVISCGTFTTDGSGNATVTLGWEPQWIMRKSSSSTATGWEIGDNMRGMPAPPTGGPFLTANTAFEESSLGTRVFGPTATGFTAVGSPSTTYIYIAIRRGPMRTPTSGASVYSNLAYTGDQTDNRILSQGSSAPNDLFMFMDRTNGAGTFSSNGLGSPVYDRLRGISVSNTSASKTAPALGTQFTNAETGVYAFTLADTQTNFSVSGNLGALNTSGVEMAVQMFRRAPGFFDVVCYTGTGSATTQAHNLGAVPELMIVKGRSGATAWQVYTSALANTEYLVLNTTAPKATGTTRWNSTTPTSSVFSIGTATEVNTSAATYVAYLFATLAGVSKVGSYTGTGAAQTINCGFTSGARFVLIKRTDSAGAWYVWDTARGIVAGNDPYLLLNSIAAEVTATDYIDTLSSGFEISSTAPNAINANGGTFIYLAIA
jgi:hypothetical protein